MALDFPSSPIDGQVYDNFVYSASKGTWKSLSAGTTPTVLVNPTITNAVITATAPNATTVPLMVSGATSQSANLQEWKNSSGTTLASIDSGGGVVSDNARFTNLYLNRQNSNNEGGQVNLRRSLDNADSWFIDVYGETSTPSLRFVNSNSVPMQIDASGRVSMPYQPSFLAVKADNSGSYSGDYVFNTAINNTGNHYSTSTGRFTAPISGKYYFTAELQTWGIAVGTQTYINFKKNGSDYIHANIGDAPKAIVNKTGDSTYHNTVVLSAVIDCSSGDYVNVFTSNTRGTQSWFTGFLIG